MADEVAHATVIVMMTAVAEAMDVATTMALVALVTMTVAMAAVMTMAREESTDMLPTVAMVAGTADVMIVEAVEVATTTGLLLQLLVATTPLLPVMPTEEDGRTRVITIALTASPLLTQAEPKRY